MPTSKGLGKPLPACAAGIGDTAMNRKRARKMVLPVAEVLHVMAGVS
jgi:hypothetical protein